MSEQILIGLHFSCDMADKLIGIKPFLRGEEGDCVGDADWLGNRSDKLGERESGTPPVENPLPPFFLPLFLPPSLLRKPPKFSGGGGVSTFSPHP